MEEVRVGKVHRIEVPVEAGAPPRKPVILTFYDTFWMILPPMQRLFFYQTGISSSTIVENFKTALSRVLPVFYSLVGKLHFDAKSDEVIISFSEDDGVDLVEAICEGGHFERLAKDIDQNVDMYKKLAPGRPLKELPAPVFSLQVTEFPGEGLAVGISVHHLAVDGKALWQFIDAWAAESRILAGGAAVEKVSSQPMIMDRSLVTSPGAAGVAKHYRDLLSPNLPSLVNDKLPIPMNDGLKAARRTFTLSSAAVEALKEAGTTPQQSPTSFVALAAHAWISALKAKHVPADELDSALCFFLDLRQHLSPSVPAEFFGNCQKPCAVYAKSSELLAGGDTGLKVAVSAIQKEIAACLNDPVVDCKTWLEKLFKLPRPRRIGVQAWPDLRVYERADFGFGRPVRSELVSMHHDGDVVLVASKEEEGGVQATVALPAPFMDSFGDLFLSVP